MRLLPILPTLLVWFAAEGAQVDIYKWTDAQGRVHYSDAPPPEGDAGRMKIRVNSISGPALVSTINAPAAAAGKQRVRVYSTRWCGYCKRAKSYLTGRGVSFDEIDVEASESGRREFAALGGRGVPVILVGDRRMDGFDPGVLEGLLAQAGY